MNIMVLFYRLIFMGKINRELQNKNADIKEKKFTIQPFLEKDEIVIKNLGFEITAELVEKHGIPSIFNWNNVKETYGHGGIFFVAKDNQGNVIGFGGAEKITNDVLYCSNGRVVKEFRGQGVMTKILEEIIKFAKNNQYRKITAKSPEPIAQKILIKLGFKEIANEGKMIFYDYNCVNKNF